VKEQSHNFFALSTFSCRSEIKKLAKIKKI